METFMQPDQNPQLQSPQPPQTPETPQPTPVEPVAGSQPVATPAPVTPNGKKKLPTWAKILLIAFGSVVGFIGLAVLGFFLYANSLIAAPAKVSDQFINAAQANDPSQAYNLTSPAFKNVTSEERLARVFDQVSPEIQGEEKISDKHYRVNNGVTTATLVYEIPSGDETSYVRVSLRKTDDKWEVLSMFTSKQELKADTN